MFQIIGYKVITDTRCVPRSCTRSNSSENSLTNLMHAKWLHLDFSLASYVLLYNSASRKLIYMLIFVILNACRYSNLIIYIAAS